MADNVIGADRFLQRRMTIMSERIANRKKAYQAGRGVASRTLFGDKDLPLSAVILFALFQQEKALSQQEKEKTSEQR